MNILRDFFGPKPHFESIPKTDVDTGEDYKLRILRESVELAGNHLFPGGPRAGAIITGDSRSLLVKRPSAPSEFRKKIVPQPSKKYFGAPIMNQGQVGACVGFAYCGRQNSGPWPKELTNKDGLDFYDACRIKDGTPLSLDVGTTILTGAKVARARGMITKFYDLGSPIYSESPAFVLNSIIEWLVDNRGPVVIGTILRQGMIEPDSIGRVKFSGAILGGHAMYIRDVIFTAPRNGYLVVVNSWGIKWPPMLISFDECKRVFDWFPSVIGVDEAKPKK